MRKLSPRFPKVNKLRDLTMRSALSNPLAIAENSGSIQVGSESRDL